MGLIFSVTTVHATIYVDVAATGSGDGSSWTDAFTDFQAGINAASSGEEVWVAAGSYYPASQPNIDPDETSDRFNHFSLRNAVLVYGGFAGNEISRDDRDIEANETILSGDIGTLGDDSDNGYHVFYHPEGTDLNGTAVLSGFTISGGNADGSYPHWFGGGMYNKASSPTITNCTFSGNSADLHGGGMSNASSSSPTITNCTFFGNSVGETGGGMYNIYYSYPTIIHCTFSGNSTGRNGGGMGNDSASSPPIINCTFSGNSADEDGGGMYNAAASSPPITNCTFSGNSAGENGGGMYNSDHSSPSLLNCILWGNTAESGNEVYNYSSTPTFSYCDVEGGISGTNNIDIDPLFVRNPGTNGSNDLGDLHLTSVSQCVDAGDNASFTPGHMDMDRETRIFNGTIDIGADEAVDSDGDRLSDYEENNIYGTAADNTDTDGDGLSDGDEINRYGTNPLVSGADADTDGDGLTNVDEVEIYGTDPLTPDADADTDGDGLTNVDEIDIYGTDPMDTDSDDDGLDDYLELYLWENCWNDDPDGDGLINLLDDDSNGDGINDRDAFYSGNWDADCDSGETGASTGSSGGGGGGGGCFIGTLF